MVQQDHFKNIDFDGVIAHTYNNELIHNVIRTGKPAIIRDIGIDTPCTAKIISDHGIVAQMTFDHLKSRGLKHYAFCGFKSINWAMKRQEEFRKIVVKNGFTPYIYESPDTQKVQWWDEQKQLHQWLQSLPKPIGIMAANDYRGQHIIDTCNSYGIYVPDEVAVIGVDNDEYVCELTNPPMSSIARHFEKAGYQALELLIRLIHNKKVKTRNIVIEPSNVIIRQSTNVLAVEDNAVVEALRFIRSNSQKNICIDDVVDAVEISKRRLYDKFMHSIGHSVFEEITRIRTEEIVTMLTETSIPIAQIASELDFRGADHISRYFKKQKGMSTMEYRKRYQK